MLVVFITIRVSPLSIFYTVINTYRLYEREGRAFALLCEQSKTL